MSVSNQNTVTQDQTFDVFGVQLQFLVGPDETGSQSSLYKGILPPGIVIPLHSHLDSEVFYVLAGTLEIYQESGEHKGWKSVPAGQAVAVAPDVKHALRNTSSTPSSTIAVTGRGLYEFFLEVAEPAHGGPSAPPSPEDMQRLFAAAGKYSYWMGSPEENSEIGLTLG
jgi:quercetin dioxygenase-like cupin family protein